MRYLTPLAELLESEDRLEEAAAIWVQIAERERAAQAAAFRATVAWRGRDAGLALIQRWELKAGPGHVHPRARLAQAQLLLEEGDASACVRVLSRSRLTDHDQYGPAAQRLAARCRN